MNALLVPVIFAIILLLAYLIVGSLTRYRSGITTCPEMLPNFIFWRKILYAVFRGVMCVITCGKYRPQPERVVAVMPQMPTQFRRDTQAFHQLPDVDDLDDDEFSNEPSIPVQVRY